MQSVNLYLIQFNISTFQSNSRQNDHVHHCSSANAEILKMAKYQSFTKNIHLSNSMATTHYTLVCYDTDHLYFFRKCKKLVVFYHYLLFLQHFSKRAGKLWAASRRCGPLFCHMGEIQMNHCLFFLNIFFVRRTYCDFSMDKSSSFSSIWIFKKQCVLRGCKNGKFAHAAFCWSLFKAWTVQNLNSAVKY